MLSYNLVFEVIFEALHESIFVVIVLFDLYGYSYYVFGILLSFEIIGCLVFNGVESGFFYFGMVSVNVLVCDNLVF